MLKLLITSSLIVIISFLYLFYQQYIKVENRFEKYHSDPTLSNITDFDYVIIGAGTAGSVLSSRLSENPKIKVLVLESGVSNNDLIGIHFPLGFPKFTMNTSIDYDYKTISQPQLRNREIYMPRGKVIGGSSSVNANLYIRGHPLDYNEWNYLLFNNTSKNGNLSWSYKDMLKYFKKSEKHLSKNINRKYHGTDGKWKIKHTKDIIEEIGPLVNFNLTSVIINSLSNGLNIPIRDDPNELLPNEEELLEKGEGHSILESVSYHHHSIDENGRRHSLAEAFLDLETLKRPNLQIRTECIVKRILFTKNGKNENVASGVEYLNKRTNQLIKINVRKEVISSAGSIASPQILMVSGIGDKEELKKFNIPIISNLKGVGKNLHDHLLGAVIGKLKEGYTSLHSYESLWNLLQWIMQSSFNFLEFSMVRKLFPAAIPNSWKLFNVGAPHIQGFFKSKYAKENNQPYDLQIVSVPGFFVHHASIEYPGENGISIGVVNLQPKARGYISLRSNDTNDSPIIHGNYFGNEQDIKVLVDGISQIQKTFLQEPFKSMVKEFIFCSPHDYKTHDEIRECLTQMFTTLYHPTSTCKMGSENDEMSVVDEYCKVRGVKNLRVVDASIMPNVPRGNTNAPTAAIAEKAAEMILNEWNL
ncbi:predicted protein [Naegleria gruberi]|uniref:Predicted protein n=1 Tax=Naegleria gruberi TaxID=5762 RepID=D2V9N7_NAEGR|nr:uncharacterized protein NAEGRDRAFT_65503 [Naegleria gruberi]EFC46616.1 predicted protein [Naegleria gruberi]|eukprot:XP_002679360.1 predicted protein [Naegleria gruberi strain NEG-M]